MAQFLLVSVLIHTPPSGSDFSTNDVVDVYWNDSTEGIDVKLNGSTFGGSAGAYFGTINNNYYVSGITSYQVQYAISGYSFCDSGNLKWFRMVTDFPSYPYMTERTTVDSPVCDVGGGAVCDIHFTSPRVSTSSTSLTNPNGSFTTTAASSNGTVKFALSDFDYATEGQTSGTFSNMAPGLYSLYVKDASDCTLYITFTVSYEPDESEHYRFTWASILVGAGTSHDARLRIYEREYVGDVVEVPYGDTSPFRLNKPKQGGAAGLNDKFFPIHPTNATLVLKSQKDYQFLPLFTQDNKKYRCVYEVDEGAGFVAIWSGFIVPSVYREDFIATPYSVEIQIADNVRTLEEEPFTDDSGGLMTGDMKLVSVIAHILKKTGLTLSIRSGINIFEDSHNTAATDDPLDQTYIDVTCYRDGSEPFNCWDVLEKILRPFGARIFQYDNQWIIEEIDRAVAEYAYRVFTTSGLYSSNSTFDPILDIKSPDQTDRAALVDQDHSLEVIPAFGKIDIVSKLNYVGSIVSGGFEKEDLLSPDSETFIIAQGIFKSEEDFNGWTLRQPTGVSGVNFGRVVVGQRGDSTRTGFKTENEDLTRSVGAFYYDQNQWDGNVRDAYIESAAKPYQYGPGDEFNFRFEYSTPAKPEFAFMILRFVIKLGTEYLQQDLTWDSAEHIYRAYPSVSNSLQKFELSVSLPDTDVIVDTTVQIRIYFYASEFYDYGLPARGTDPSEGTDGQSDLDGLATVDIDYDYRLDMRITESVGSVTNYWRAFLELAYSTEVESIPDGIIRVGDYDGTTNPKIWRVAGRGILENRPAGNRRGVDRKFYIDNVVLDALVNGQPPPSEETISLQISKFINEDLEIELFNFDCPDIVNAKNMYNNYFKLSDGTPTASWARSGIAESLPIQQILLKVLGGNHSAPTFRLTGSFINEFSRIGMNNYLKLTKVGSSLTASNTEFTSNLSGWTGDASGTAFSWTADNSGSAEVALTGAVNSERLYQAITHSGGYIQFTVNIHAEPAVGNDREDQLWVLFYNGTSIIHTERMQTFAAISSDSDYDFTYIAFAPGQVTKIGFYLKRINGTGACTYQFGKFAPAGRDIDEIYQIADYSEDSRNNRYTFELMQISKTYISLAGVDSGGNNQGGGTTGSAFSGGFSSGFGGGFDTILN